MEDIIFHLNRAADYVRNLGYSPSYISLHGSQNYGLELNCAEYRSDHDYKCIVLPSLYSLCEGQKPVSLTVDFEDGQIDIKDIRLFIQTVCKMNLSYLECLLTQHYTVFCSEEEFDQMRTMIPELLSEKGTEFARVCVRSFEEKSRRMDHDSPAKHEKIIKYGYDGKQVHHMYRLLLLLRAFEAHGKVMLFAPQDAHELLIDLKLNRVALSEAEVMIEGWRIELQMIEKRLAEKHGKPKDGTAKKLKALCAKAIYNHCRGEESTDGRVSL